MRKLLKHALGATSGIARAAGTCERSEVVRLVNEAQERLLQFGDWKGTTDLIKIVVREGQFSLPRVVERIEAFSVSGVPGTVRSQWYEFIENGPGAIGCNWTTNPDLIDQGDHPTLADLTSPCYLQIEFDNVRDYENADHVIIQGNNSSGAEVRTDDREGEYILPGAESLISSNEFTNITNVIKPVTCGPMRLWAIDAVTSTKQLIGYYEPWEEVGCFHRKYIPQLNGSGDKCVLMRVKLAFIPASYDTDHLLISNMPALKLMVRAIMFEEANDFDSATEIIEGTRTRSGERRGGILQLLDKELENHHGSEHRIMRVVTDGTWGGGGVPYVI